MKMLAEATPNARHERRSSAASIAETLGFPVT
jgi:hypothetical protein